MKYIWIILLSSLFLNGCNSPQAEKEETPSVSAIEKRYSGTGNIDLIETAKMRIKINHDDIEGYMYAMSMWFPIKDQEVIEELKTFMRGDRVNFVLVKRGDEAAYISKIEKLIPLPRQSILHPQNRQ